MSKSRDRRLTGGGFLVVALLAAGLGDPTGDGPAAEAAEAAPVVGAEVDCSRGENLGFELPVVPDRPSQRVNRSAPPPHWYFPESPESNSYLIYRNGGAPGGRQQHLGVDGAAASGDMRQSIATLPGDRIVWEVQHRKGGDNNANTDRLIIGGDEVLLTATDHWKTFTGTHVAADDETATVLRLKSGGSLSDGEFDEIRLKLTCRLAIAASFDGFDGDGDGSVGDVARFSFTATNAKPDSVDDKKTDGVDEKGSASLKNIVLSDGAGTAFSCRTEKGAEVTSDTVLRADDPGSEADDDHKIVCTAEHTVEQADVDRGSVVQMATVTGDDATGEADHRPTAMVSANAATAAAAPSMTVVAEKPVVDDAAAPPSGRVDAGDRVTYSFTVTNTGNVTLSRVSVEAPKAGQVTCPKTTLAPKATTTCAAAAVVLSQAQVDAGELAVAATAKASPSRGAQVTDTAAGKAVLAAAPAATLAKSASAKPPVKAGGKVSYSYLVTNTGNVTLTGLSVSDPKTGKTTCPETKLAPKATTTCTAVYTATSADIKADLIENSARAVVKAPNGRTVAASDSVSFSPRTGKVIADRLAGKDRYSTAVEISRATFAPKVATVYIATGVNFPDALAGSAASGGDGPILLVTRDSIPGGTLNELRRLKPRRIVVLGGEGVVSTTVKVKLSAYARTTRQAGPDRYATAAEISAAHFDPRLPVAYVATGEDYPDALTGGPAAAKLGGPILLTRKDKLPPATIAELKRLKPKSIVVLGGTGVVSGSVQTALKSQTSGKVSRLAGSHRYSTGAAISKAAFGPGAPVAYVATGANFPDALAGGAAGAFRDGPVLLVSGGTIPEATKNELRRLKPKKIIVLGGPSVAPRSVRQALGAYLR